jgi:hypothetical protein
MFRRKAARSTKARSRSQAPSTSTPSPPADGLTTLLTGGAVTAQTPLGEGDDLQAEYGGQWWPARVLALEEDGQVKITYPGWGKEWDEIVPRSRLRLPSAGPTRLKVVLDTGLSLTGTFVTMQGDLLVLAPGRGGKKFVIQTGRVLYFEVDEAAEGR